MATRVNVHQERPTKGTTTDLRNYGSRDRKPRAPQFFLLSFTSVLQKAQRGHVCKCFQDHVARNPGQRWIVAISRLLKVPVDSSNRAPLCNTRRIHDVGRGFCAMIRDRCKSHPEKWIHEEISALLTSVLEVVVRWILTQEPLCGLNFSQRSRAL